MGICPKKRYRRISCIVSGLTKYTVGFIIHLFACGRGGIGIRARLRGVSGNGYGFKSRRPHQYIPCDSNSHRVFVCPFAKIAIKKPQCRTTHVPLIADMVEMRGVEPLSENPSNGLSPSAFRALISLSRPFTEKLPEK